MLVLSRKIGERIVIGGGITIMVVEIRQKSGGSIVRLGIDAPKDVEVHRQEAAGSIKREGRKQ